MRVLVILLALAMGTPLWAGAWMREEGKTFMSVTGTVRHDGQLLSQETSIYIDYGFKPRLSLGLDINESPGNAGHALIYARLPIVAGDKPYRIAAELALGGHHDRGKWHGMLKATLSYGRGFQSRWGSGWMAADAAVERRMGSPKPLYKLDATLGLSSTKGWARPLLKLETALMPGKDLIWAISPGLMFDSKNGKNTYVIGLEHRRAERSKLGISFSLWRNF